MPGFWFLANMGSSSKITVNQTNKTKAGNRRRKFGGGERTNGNHAAVHNEKF
jgi:hypothetical protein